MTFPTHGYLNELADRIHTQIDEVAERHQMSQAEVIGLIDMVKQDILLAGMIEPVED